MSGKDNPTKTYALKCLNEIKGYFNDKGSIEDINGYFEAIENYIEGIAKQRQDKRDSELKEICSKVVKGYLTERTKLIEKLKSFISKNSLSSKEFLIGNNWIGMTYPICYENNEPGYYEKNWVEKEFIIQFPIYKECINLIIPMEGSPLNLSNPYDASILKVEIFKDSSKYPYFSKEFKWSFASMESPWLVCNSILKKIYKEKSYHIPSEEFEGLMLQILHAYPKTRYHK